MVEAHHRSRRARPLTSSGLLDARDVPPVLGGKDSMQCRDLRDLNLGAAGTCAIDPDGLWRGSCKCVRDGERVLAVRRGAEGCSAGRTPGTSRMPHCALRSWSLSEVDSSADDEASGGKRDRVGLAGFAQGPDVTWATRAWGSRRPRRSCRTGRTCRSCRSRRSSRATRHLPGLEVARQQRALLHLGGGHGTVPEFLVADAAGRELDRGIGAPSERREQGQRRDYIRVGEAPT